MAGSPVTGTTYHLTRNRRSLGGVDTAAPWGYCAHPHQLAGLQPYRGVDHREPYAGDHLHPARDGCRHPTPPPRGYRRCAGDPGCEFRLAGRAGERCPFHGDARTPGDEYWDLMGARRNPRLPDQAEL